jgi:hypothetical protein
LITTARNPARLKTKIRLAQAFIPGNSDAGFPGKSPRIVAGFTRFFKKGDAVAVLRIDIFRKLLRFERRPGAVGVQTQLQIGNRFQQQVNHHAVAHRFIQPDFDLRDFFAGHRRQPGKQLVRIAGAQRRRAISAACGSSPFSSASAQLTPKATEGATARVLALRQALAHASSAACASSSVSTLNPGRGEFPPALAFTVLQVDEQPIAGF